jgi:hypothetical protein
VAVRPAILLPPKRLSTPRSARHLSTTDRGLLLGAPVPTQAGLTPAGLVQLAGRNMGARLAGGLDSASDRRGDGDPVSACAVGLALSLKGARQCGELISGLVALLGLLSVGGSRRGDGSRSPHLWRCRPAGPLSGSKAQRREVVSVRCRVAVSLGVPEARRRGVGLRLRCAAGLWSRWAFTGAPMRCVDLRLWCVARLRLRRCRG